MAQIYRQTFVCNHRDFGFVFEGFFDKSLSFSQTYIFFFGVYSNGNTTVKRETLFDDVFRPKGSKDPGNMIFSHFFKFLV
jgi:hypothetical protein